MAGLCAALAAEGAESGAEGTRGERPEILVLDAGKEPGRKILATGNGRCNLTNRVQEADCYRCGSGRNVMPLYESGWDREMTDFMASLGVPIRRRRCSGRSSGGRKGLESGSFANAARQGSERRQTEPLR